MQKANCFNCKRRYIAGEQEYCTKYKSGIPEELLLSEDNDCKDFLSFIHLGASNDK